MPETTENFHWIPVKDAADFVQDSFRQITLNESQGIHARIGKLKSDPEGGTTIQSYYFDKDRWSMSDAQAWVKEHKKSSPAKPERRCIESTMRMDFNNPKQPRMEGYAAVFNSRTEIWPGFHEEIAPGAFADAIRSKDIYALWNHNPSDVLGNTGSETLTLEEDERGLKYSIVPPDTTLGRDLQTLIKRGDIRKSSFGFNIDKEEVQRIGKNEIVRRIVRVSPLYDVSPVTYPAYKETEVHVRMIECEQERYFWNEASRELIEVPAQGKPPAEAKTDAELFAEMDALIIAANKPRR